LAELGRERLEPSLIDIARGDPGALACEGEGGRAADPAPRARDDDDLAGEAHAASVMAPGSDMPRAAIHSLASRSVALWLGWKSRARYCRIPRRNTRRTIGSRRGSLPRSRFAPRIPPGSCRSSTMAPHSQNPPSVIV